jgi:hypothetical protein
MLKNTSPNWTASSQQTTAGRIVELQELPKEALQSVDSAKLELQVGGQSLLSQTEAKKNLLDKIVLVLVISGSIVFAIFQITQCVAAYAQPISTSNLESRNRVLPGLMICPYVDSGLAFHCAEPTDSELEFYPLWAPDATLSFDFRRFTSPCSIYSKSYDSSDSLSILSIADKMTIEKRSKCPNAIPLNDIPFAPKGGNPHILFGAIHTERLRQSIQDYQDALNSSGPLHPPSECSEGSSARRVTVKNSAKSLVCSSEGCRSSQSNTPPNVQCLAYDPSFFDDDFKENPGTVSDCNPMREVKPNSVDTFIISFPHLPIVGKRGLQTPVGTYEYSGLRCPAFSPSELKLSAEAFTQQVNSLDDASINYGMFNNITLFGHFVALAYDSEKGVPKDIDFDDVTSAHSGVSSSQQDHILASTILAHVERLADTVPPRSTPPYYIQRVFPVTLQASIDIKTRFTNAALGETNTTATPTAVFAPLSSNPYRIEGEIILMSFSTVLTTVTREVVTLSILTTISIIVSTATALWGAQQTIKDGILMVAAKVNAIRGAAQPKHL